MRVLVTGDTGHLGSYLLPELKQKHSDVELYGLSRIHAPSENHFKCDIRHYRQLEAVFDEVRPDFVYHLAAQFGRVNGEHFFETLWNTNVVGTENIVRLCSVLGCRLAFASSSEAYGDIAAPEGGLTEDLIDRFPVHHYNSYAMTKWVGEHIILNHEKKSGLQAMRLRFFNIYGPGEPYSPYRSVTCLFCYKALHNLPYVIYDDGCRSFLYIDDFIVSLANVMDDFRAGEAVNFSGTEYTSVREMSDIILRQVGITEEQLGVAHIASEAFNVQSKLSNNDKAFRFYGHKQKTSLEVGISKTLEWMCREYKDTIVNWPDGLA